MEEEDKAMEMIRLPKQEVLYDRDIVLGRDVNSVFPNQAKEEKKTQMDNLSKALGLDNSRFISASELEKIKKAKGPSVESGTISRDKSLAAVLAENKAKKEEEFANVWKTMKQGKNRPLDEDDMSFVNSLADAEAAKESSLREKERSELEAYQQAVRKAAEQRQQNSVAPESKNPSQPEGEQIRRPPRQTQVKSVKPVIKVKQKTSIKSTPQHDHSEGIPSKRKRDDDNVGQEAEKEEVAEEAGTLGLGLGGYASEEE